MSIFDDNLLDIALYYTYKSRGSSRQLLILDDEKAQKMLEDPEQKEQVEVMNTKWQELSWLEHNEMMRQLERSNPNTGEPSLDWPLFNDARVKKCLKWWDLKASDNDPQPLPVEPQWIDKLPAPIVRALLERYDEATTVTEELEKKISPGSL